MNPTSVAAYAAVNATTRALYSTLLTPEVRLTLAHAPDFDTLLSTLGKTAYAPYLALDRAALTPRRTSYQLHWHLAKIYEKLIRMTPEPGNQLLLQLWRLYEVDNLKATLRGIETGASWDEVRHLLFPMFRHITLTPDELNRMLATGSIVRAVERTQGTPYYETLTHAVERYEIERNLFPLEVALDLDYRRGVWQAIQQLKGTDHEHALKLVGTSIDVDNLLWAIRYRVYHNLSLEEIINYTLPFGYKVHDEHIRAIARSEDALAIADVVRRVFPKVADLANLSTHTRSDITMPHRWLVELEHILHRHIINLCHSTFLGDPFHIGVQLVYVMLIEYELQDLTAIIEAVSSHLPIEQLATIIDL